MKFEDMSRVLSEFEEGFLRTLEGSSQARVENLKVGVWEHRRLDKRFRF